MKNPIIVSLAILLSGCTASRIQRPSQETVSGEVMGEAAKLSERERAVVRAMLEYEAQGNRSQKPVIVLSALSSAPAILGSLDNDSASDQIHISAIRSFRRANRSEYLWPQNLDQRYDMQFLTPAQTKEIWRDREGWDRFYRKFPNAKGHTTISRVGFSSDGRLALVYRGCQSEWLAGGGQIYVLRLEHGKWTITFEHIGAIWVS